MEQKSLPEQLRADLAESLEFFVGGADFGLDDESRALLTMAAELYARLWPQATRRLSLNRMLSRSGITADMFADAWGLDTGTVRGWFSDSRRCPRWVLIIVQVLGERIAEAQEDAGDEEGRL